MERADYLGSRALKGAMAFVLAVGLCPVAPAMAQEGATANEEGAAAAAVVDGADVSTDGAVAGATGDVAGSEADGVQPGGVSGDADVAAGGAGVGASVQDAVENDASDSGISAGVVEAAFAADGEADESNDADAQTDGWQAWGGCEWMVDSEGCLTIRPKDGAEVGQLPNTQYYFGCEVPWRASGYSQSIQSVRVAAGVKTSEYAYRLFDGLSSVTFMDLSDLDISSATSMQSMFSGCSSLASLDLSGWDTSSVKQMGYMFYGCSSLREVSLGEATRVGLPTPSGDGLTGRWVSSADGIAYRAADLPSGVAATYTVQHSDSVVGVACSSGGCTWKVGADGALVIAPRPDSSSGILDYGRVHPDDEVLWSQFSRDILSVHVEPGVKISGSASQLFANLPFAESMDLSGLDTSAVTDMSSMFSGCTLLQAIDLSSFDTSSVTDMSSVFNGCESLGALDLSSFDTSKVENMSQMFQGCSSLASLDLLSFDTSSVAGSDGTYYHDGMCGMFQGCSSLTSLDLSSFNTSKVRNMGGMFQGDKRLKSVNLSSFDTKNTAYFYSMFSGCSALECLDLSNFNTSHAIGSVLTYMFSDCSSLKSLDVSSFDTSRITNFSNMFSGCDSLESLDLSSFDTTRATKMDYMFGYGSGGALSRITLGEKFSFSKNGERLCSLPSDWGDAGWYDESVGKAYSVDEIPDNIAATYVKQKRLDRNQFTIDDSWSAYTGAPIKKPIKSNLVEGVDYVVSYENNIGPGGANIYIRGINRWYGELSYYFYIDGSAQRGQWMHDSNGWWYVDASGSYPSNEWRAIDGSYYYFNGSGYMCTNWLNYGGAWYWLGSSGAMATGWRSIGGSWYFFDDSGAMASGWKQIGGTYYHFSGSGAMQTGWLNTGGVWYYLSGSGAMATGWLSLGGTWYWFDASGAMASGWSVIDGSCYYFDGSGAMQTDKRIDGSYVDSDGRWVQNA